MPLSDAVRRRAFTAKMTLDRAAMMRGLRGEGARIFDLAHAFGCCYTLANDICRGRKWTGTPCKGCWRLIAPVSGGRGEYCEECRKGLCSHCGGAKPAGRASKRCRACDRENQQGVIARKGECRECGEKLPETRHSRLCAECATADSATQRRFRDNRGKVCRQEGCDNPLPLSGSWSRRLCRECAKENDRLRRALSRRYCGICGKVRKDESKAGLCPECLKIDRQIKEVSRKMRIG